MLIPIGMLILFTGCEEIESTAVEIDESKTATLKLYVKAEMDPDQTGPETVPDGTELVFSVMYNDLNGSFNGEGRWMTTAATSNGVVEVTVPATDYGVWVYVNAISFEYAYPVSETETELRAYEFNARYPNIFTGSKTSHMAIMNSRSLEINYYIF